MYNVTGRLGAGKTLLIVIMGNDDFKLKNIEVKSNFFTTFSKKINPLEIARFEIENCTVLLDEAHTIFDSRNSHSPLNKLFSYFFTQSRKRDVNIYCTTQFNHLIDRRMRDLADYTVKCFPRKNRAIDDFYYTLTVYDEPLDTFRLRYSNAQKFFDMYNTKEKIVPMIIDEESINFDDLIEDFNACDTKRSFVALIKKTYLHLDIESIGACYDFIKKDDMKRAKRVLFCNVTQG